MAEININEPVVSTESVEMTADQKDARKAHLEDKLSVLEERIKSVKAEIKQLSK